MRKGFLGALTFSFCILNAQAKPQPAVDSTIPGYQQIELSRGAQNHLLMPAIIGGRPVTFLLDTAIEINLLQADRASSLGLAQLGQEAVVGGRSLPVAQADDLRAGGANLGKEVFALYQASQLGGPIPGVAGSRADGVIGLDFLQRHQAVINCRTRHLFLRTDPARRLDPATAIQAGFVRVPIEESRRGFLTVPCSIHRRPGRLILDTGAFLTGIDNDAARSLGLSGHPSRITARGLDGKVQPVHLVRIDDLKIGGFSLPSQEFVVLDVFGKRQPLRTFTGINRIEYYEPRRTARGDTIFGLLGNEILDQHRAIIDLGSMSLLLR